MYSACIWSSDCCTFPIPQLLTHLSLPGKCRIVLNVRQCSNSWQLQLHFVLAVCSLHNDRGASSSCSFSFSFLSPSAGRLSYCTVYNTLILALVSLVVSISFSVSWKLLILIVGPVFKAVPLQRSSRLQGGIFFCSHFHLVKSFFFYNFSYSYSKKDFMC